MNVKCLSRLCFMLLCLAYLSKPAAVHAQVDQQDAQKALQDLQNDLIERARNEYRQFFKEPKETREFWAVINFEVSLGKFELAGFFLKKLLEKDPKVQVDEELIKIYESVGHEPFFRLQDIKKWSVNEPFDKECRENAALLLKRISDGIEKKLSDPERIKKYIGLLNAPAPAERDNAIRQLKRSREKVIPFLLDTIRKEPGSRVRTRIIEWFIVADKEIVAPLYEILKAADDEDAKDVNLRLAVLDIFRGRADMDCIPYLWHLSSSKKYPAQVRDAARAVLAYLREEDPAKLPPAKFMLTQMAEKCFQHKLKVEVGGKRFYLWDGGNLSDEPDFMPKRRAEYFFGVRYAREALDLDPGYKPAQTVLLNFYLERTFDQNLDKYFFTPMPADVQRLMLDLEPEFLMSILERALNENNVPIILPVIDILGVRGELRVAQPTFGNPPRALLRGLYYPDRRVQFATVNALLKIPYRGAPADAVRVVEVLARFLATEPVSRTLVAMTPKSEALPTENTFKLGGFTHVETHCSTLEVTFDKLRRSADYDIIFVHPAATPAEVPYVVTQLRGDPDQGRLPLIILSRKEHIEKWRKLFERYPNTWVELDTYFLTPDALKRLAEDKIELTSAGYQSSEGGYKLSLEERKKFADDSMKFLWQMGKGEITGYNVRHAQDILRATLHRPDLAKMALETAALNPDRDTQIWLANVFFDPAFDKLKLTTIVELRQHILKNGLRLEKHQIDNLKDAQKTADTPELQMQLTLILANLRFSPQQSGKRLSDFNPPIK